MFKDKAFLLDFLNDFMRKDKIKFIFISLIFIGLLLLGIGLKILFKISQFGVVEATHQQQSDDSSIKFPLQTIKVDISGEVVNPGIYEIEYGLRIAELVELAGGFSDQADLEYIFQNLNLAKKVIDEEKVYIFSKSERQRQNTKQSLSSTEELAAVASNNDKISINQASQSELMELDGVGEKRAAQIIENRPFQSVDELVVKEILSQNALDKIEAQIEL